MTHVKHLGWELETKVLQIVNALAWVPVAQREVVVLQLKPLVYNVL